MGEEIIIQIPGSYYFWITLAFGIISFVVALFYLMDRLVEGNSQKPFVVFLIITLLLLGTTPLIAKNYDDPASQVNYETTLNKLQPIEKVYQANPFYLKESTTDMGIQGELKGKIGGFLFVAGSIYGHIDSGRVVTVVYEDNDPLIDHYIDVHRSISFPLDEAVIVTIAAGERPYIMYPEAELLVVDRNNEQLGPPHKMKLIPGTPHLYLPEGWKIL